MDTGDTFAQKTDLSVWPEWQSLSFSLLDLYFNENRKYIYLKKLKHNVAQAPFNSSGLSVTVIWK